MNPKYLSRQPGRPAVICKEKSSARWEGRVSQATLSAAVAESTTKEHQKARAETREEFNIASINNAFMSQIFFK